MNTNPHPIFLGVDPGLTGSLAFYCPSNGSLEVHDMPTTMPPLKNAKSAKRKINVGALAMLIDQHAPRTQMALIELVAARPGAGVTSMFNFGYGAGLLAGILGAHYISVIHTPPSVWKTLAGLSADKNLSREVAMKKFPKHADAFKRKCDHDRAEATLLAVLAAERFSK